MKDINQVTLRGHIGSVRFFGQNNSIASISVATTDGYRDKSGEWKETTTWHRVKAFSSRPGMIDFSLLEKGQAIEVNGKIATSKYTDREGNERESTEVEANDLVIILDQRAASNNKQGGNRAFNYNDEDF